MSERFGSFVGSVHHPVLNFKKHEIEKLFSKPPVDGINAGDSHVLHCITNLNFK